MLIMLLNWARPLTTWLQCTEDELNRRERRRASNRKAAQSARDRRVKKQEQLETQIEQYHAEQKRFDEQRKQVNTGVKFLY